jgi:hypothetical protein
VISREKKVQWWQLKTKPSLKIILKTTFLRKKFTANAGYVDDEETVDHLTSGSPILVKNEYLMINDTVGAHLHY